MSRAKPSALARAVKAANGVPGIAQACGVSVQAVYKWLKKGHPPTSRCQAIEIATGGRVSRFDLLPPAVRAVIATSTGRHGRVPVKVANLRE